MVLGPDGLTGAPDGMKVELEVTAGDWRDITSKVEWSAGLKARFGRSTLYSQVSPSNLSLMLNNSDGRFTAGRQTLRDGTAHPYWPNLLPNRRIRVTLTTGATVAPIFFGYVDGWPTSFVDARPRIALTAGDRLQRLAAQVTELDAPLLAEIRADSPAAYYPLDDSGTVFFNDGIDPTRPYLIVGGESSAPLSSGTGPSVGVPRAVQFAPSSTTVGEYLISPDYAPFVASAISIEVAMTAGAGDGSPIILLGDDGAGGVAQATIKVAGGVFTGSISNGTTTITVTSSVPLVPTAWYHVMLTATSGGAIRLYVNGALAASGTAPAFTFVAAALDLNVFGRIPRSMASVAYYPTVLSAARAAARYSAMTDWEGELLSARVARLLTLAGVAPVEQTVQSSTVKLSASPQGGVDPVSAVQALTDTEGNGSVFYVEPAGTFLFTNRANRRSRAPIAIIDAEKDLAGDVWAPAFGLEAMLNTCRVTLAEPLFLTGLVLTATDPTSIAMYGPLGGGDFTSYESFNGITSGTLPTRALNNAQQRVNAGAQPRMRLSQFAVDLWTCETPGLYAALTAARVGDPVRLVNLPDNVGPARQIDVVVEGWTFEASDQSCRIVFDTSPADNPADLVWDDATYGRWQANGHTLTAGITATATTLQITSPAGGARFTTDPAMYPLTISVGAEHIQLTGPPSGGTSPQTFTGAVRAADGTFAAAQAASSPIDLAPASTWTL